VPLLARLIRETNSPLAKHHALGALDGLGALQEDAVLTTLGDREPRVRERALVMAERLAERHAPGRGLLQKIGGMVDDPDTRVRFQLAFTLQSLLAATKPLPVNSPLATAYTRLAARDAGDKWISAALLSGPPEVVNGILFPAMTRNLAQAKKAAPFVAKLIEIRAASKPPEGYAALIDFVAQTGTSATWLRALGDGLRRAGSSLEQADSKRKLTGVFSRAAAVAADAKAPVPARLEAIELLGVSSLAQSRAPLVACLAAGQPEAVQTAAIKTLAQHASPEVTNALVRSWAQLAPKPKESLLAALMGREERATALLQTIQAGAIKPAELPAAEVQALVHHKNPKVAALAKTALASVIPPSRAEVAAKFQPAVDMPGDALRGRTQYLGRCAVCHRANGEGLELGPDLNTVKTKGRDALLEAIIDPHKEVAPQYIAYDVTTRDGNAYTGIIEQDDATSLSLKIMGGAQLNIPRANVKGSTSSGKSIMPDGLEAGMTVQDMADLLTFMEQVN
jgi:putative heme-binding domain-containing protein